MGIMPLVVTLLMIVIFILAKETGSLFNPRLEPQKNSLMNYDPHTGEQDTYKPKHPDSYRRLYHDRDWYFNPWTGKRRKDDDVREDPKGEFILVKKNRSIFNRIS